VQSAPAADTSVDTEERRFDVFELGKRLREVRRRYGYTRLDVERLTEGRWTATALGTYERGERLMTAVRLFALADFYRVPVATLVDAEPVPPADPQVDSIVVDTSKLAELTHWPRVSQFVEAVQNARRGPHRRLLSLRGRDLPRLAAVHNEPVEGFLDALAEDGILVVRRG
jgi:transcriptional regulator with XRE-family HTH domain